MSCSWPASTSLCHTSPKVMRCRARRSGGLDEREEGALGAKRSVGVRTMESLELESHGRSDPNANRSGIRVAPPSGRQPEHRKRQGTTVTPEPSSSQSATYEAND